MYSIIRSEEAKALALKLAKGVYQRNIIHGSEAISGATLKGRAKQYSGRYKQSCDNLLARLVTNRLAMIEIRPKGKKMLIIDFI